MAWDLGMVGGQSSDVVPQAAAGTKLRELRDLLEALVTDNELRANAGMDVNWALIHLAEQVLRRNQK